MSDKNAHKASTAGINPLDNEVVLQNVHPSFLNWKWRLFFAVLFIIAGGAAGGQIGMYVIIFGGLLVVSVFLSRSRSRYIVTNQRIKTHIGFLGSSTNETRISNVSGISTDSGIIEGIVGKGTVSITDNARENLYIKGVGNYKELARTLREQQQSVQQPGTHQQPSTQQDHSVQPESLQSSTENQQQESTQSDSSQSTAENQQTETQHAETKDRDLTQSAKTVDSSSQTDETAVKSTLTTDSELSEGRETSSQPAEAGSLQESRESPVKSIADSLSTHRRFNSTTAAELCEALSDKSSTKEELEAVLTETIETLETNTAVVESLAQISPNPDTRSLNSATQRIRRETGELPDTIEPVLERMTTSVENSKQQKTSYNDELDEVKRERDTFRDAADTLCRAVYRTEAVTLQSNAVDAQAEELADAFKTGELVVETPESPLSSAVDEVERLSPPRTRRSEELLTVLTEPEGTDVTAVLQSTVEAIDEYDELRTALDNISKQDVRRQLDSLDADLQQEDEPIYRHLADRIRELEAMVDRETVDEIQLYAIYQESRFYDRTLIPRLARSSRSSESIDISQQRRDIQSRIDAIRTEYVDVRADHNHTIPNHFLELADSLCSRAQRLDGTQSQQAAGILAAAAELLGHVEQLYERNEYSVMLRRLRG